MTKKQELEMKLDILMNVCDAINQYRLSKSTERLEKNIMQIDAQLEVIQDEDDEKIDKDIQEIQTVIKYADGKAIQKIINYKYVSEDI